MCEVFTCLVFIVSQTRRCMLQRARARCCGRSPACGRSGHPREEHVCITHSFCFLILFFFYFLPLSLFLSGFVLCVLCMLRYESDCGIDVSSCSNGYTVADYAHHGHQSAIEQTLMARGAQHGAASIHDVPQEIIVEILSFLDMPSTLLPSL